MIQPTVLHLFCGLGGGALGFQAAGFGGVGAIDTDPAACRDFTLLTGEPATVADIGAMAPADLRAIAGERRPDVVFTSPPCRGFSGCLPAKVASTNPYRDLNSLALHGVWLALEAWPVPPPIILLENVPRIQSRGADWLRGIAGLLRGYGYAVTGGTHDCGELGGLAQRRRRFLLIARHMEQVPELIYRPPLRKHRSLGDVLSELPVPDHQASDGGAMHRLPRMSTRTPRQSQPHP